MSHSSLARLFTPLALSFGNGSLRRRFRQDGPGTSRPLLTIFDRGGKLGERPEIGRPCSPYHRPQLAHPGIPISWPRGAQGQQFRGLWAPGRSATAAGGEKPARTVWASGEFCSAGRGLPLQLPHWSYSFPAWGEGGVGALATREHNFVYFFRDSWRRRRYRSWPTGAEPAAARTRGACMVWGPRRHGPITYSATAPAKLTPLHAAATA
jgi:hypothetical protein